MNIILFDNEAREHLLPLTATRPMAEIRCGILTIREKWERAFSARASYLTTGYLAEKFPLRYGEDNLIINAGILPTPALFERIQRLGTSQALLASDEDLLAARLDEEQFERLLNSEELSDLEGIRLDAGFEILRIARPFDIFMLNGRAIEIDFAALTRGRRSATISPTNRVLGFDNIFIEEGASVECCFLNGKTGPIYIAKGAEVMEGAMLRGPLAVGEGSIVKMGAKIYGPTTIGPGSRAGGEIARTVIFGNSNKGHDGFLGDSVVGEWCNLGADTNNSNLKNNYADVKLWDYASQKFEPTGLQFCGLVLGDHSKTGINTMLNTGTVVGVGCNVFGAGFPRNFVPAFSWGGHEGLITHRLATMLETAEIVLKRRGQELTELDRAILERIFNDEAHFRTWEKAKA